MPLYNKKQDPINKLIHIRINKETENHLEEVAKRDNVSKSEVIRRGIEIQCKEDKNEY